MKCFRAGRGRVGRGRCCENAGDESCELVGMFVTSPPCLSTPCSNVEPHASGRFLDDVHNKICSTTKFLAKRFLTIKRERDEQLRYR